MFHLRLSMMALKQLISICHQINTENFKIQSRNTSILKFMPPKYSIKHDKVAATELTLTYYGVKHHNSYNSQNCCNKLYSCVFSDCLVTTKISCSRRKSEALVTSVLLPLAQERLKKYPILNWFKCL